LLIEFFFLITVVKKKKEGENNLLLINIISDIVIEELKLNINAPIKGLLLNKFIFDQFILKICDIVVEELTSLISKHL